METGPPPTLMGGLRGVEIMSSPLLLIGGKVSRGDSIQLCQGIVGEILLHFFRRISGSNFLSLDTVVVGTFWNRFGSFVTKFKRSQNMEQNKAKRIIRRAKPPEKCFGRTYPSRIYSPPLPCVRAPIIAGHMAIQDKDILSSLCSLAYLCD